MAEYDEGSSPSAVAAITLALAGATEDARAFIASLEPERRDRCALDASRLAAEVIDVLAGVMTDAGLPTTGPEVWQGVMERATAALEARRG